MRRPVICLSRRRAAWAFGISITAPAVVLSGCAVSPVSGERILVGMAERDELTVDRTMAAHQFSLDMGAIQDPKVNAYVTEVGERLQRNTHRKSMPYNYRVVNANYLNAYTFPGGSMALTRGIMIELQSEAELAGVLGHELGHVNARHAAQRQGQALLAAVALATVEAATRDSRNRELVGIGSQLGASVLLASYSREFEREADSLGQEYLARADYPAAAMVMVHEMLVRTEKEKPGLLETMFSSHPMSAERVRNARALAVSRYSLTQHRSIHRERFMDNTASLRALKPTIEENRDAELLMGKKKMTEAHSILRTTLRRSPNDYPTLFRLAQINQALNHVGEALRYAQEAQNVYPQEAQAHKLVGVLQMQRGNPAAALTSYQQYERFLSGDIGVSFLKGLAHESLGDRTLAARQFQVFLNGGGSGEGATYARERMKKWGLTGR
jgi:predicted Zn-dependent protease